MFSFWTARSTSRGRRTTFRPEQLSLLPGAVCDLTTWGGSDALLSRDPCAAARSAPLAAGFLDDLDQRRDRPGRLGDRSADPPALRRGLHRLQGDHRRAGGRVLLDAAGVRAGVGPGLGPRGTQAGAHRV